MLPEEVIRKYSATVYRIAFARTGTKADADDIYQEVFFRYIKKLPEFREEEHAKAWFIKVTVSCANKFMGARVRKTEFAGEGTGEFLQSDEKSPYGKHMTIEEKLLAEEKKAELYKELQKMSPDTRVLVHLYYFEGLKTREIAKLMHRKESTVRVQLARAREKLREQFEADGVSELFRV